MQQQGGFRVWSDVGFFPQWKEVWLKQIVGELKQWRVFFLFPPIDAAAAGGFRVWSNVGLLALTTKAKDIEFLDSLQ
jgi:hypothetical protein